MGMSATERLKFVLTADASGAISAFEKVGSTAEKELKKADSGSARASAQLTKFGTGAIVTAGVMGTALVGLAGNFSSLGVTVGKFSTATGLSAEKSSRWVEVAGDVGIEADSLESSINKMNKTAGTTPDKFDEMGVAIARTSSGAVDANQTFLNVIDKLKGITDPAERARVGTALLGKSWTGMSELIAAGSSSLTSSLAAVNDAKVFDDAKVQKAKDYRAAMDTLKDSLEELGLSIGAGAAPVIATLSNAIGGAVSAFGSLNSITSGAAGTFLATATAAIGAGGAIAVVAGQALKAKDSLMPMVDGSRALSGVGKAALGAGLLVAGFTVITALMGAKAADAKQDVDNLAGRMEHLGLTAEEAAKQGITEYVNGNDKLKDAMKLAGLTADDLRSAVVKGGDALSTFKDRIVAAAKANNDNADAGPRVLLAAQNVTNEIDRQHTAYVTLTDGVKKTQEATAAIGETEKERADRIKETTDALKAQADAEKALRLEELAAIDVKWAYQLAVLDGKDAIAAYNLTMKDNKSTADDQERAYINAQKAIRDTAKAYADGKGDIDGSTQSINDQIASLYIQASTLAPGSPLMVGLQEQLRLLQGIATAGAAGTVYYGQVAQGRRANEMPPDPPIKPHGATGGIVTRPTNALIGEAGPEMVVPLSSMPGASPLPSMMGGGGVINLTVNAGLGTDGVAVGQQIVNMLKQYQRANGPFDFASR